MRIRRNAFLMAATGVFTATGLPRWPAGAAEFEYKWTTDLTPNGPVPIRMNQAAQKIYEQTGGRMRLRVYPSSALATSAEMPTFTRLGVIEFSTSAYATLEPTVKAAGVVSIPFAYAGQKDALDAMNGPFGKTVRAAVEKTGLKIFDVTWDMGFRQVTNSVRPIRVPADMKGLKIRTSSAPVPVAMWKAFGASPTVVDATQMYLACQTHLVDATDNALGNISDFKLYEVQKYGSIVNTTWTAVPQMANPAAWRRLPRNIQDIVESNINSFGVVEQADVAKRNVTDVKSLSDKGMLVNEADIASFKATIRAAGLYAQWRSVYGAEIFDLLQQAVGRLV